MQTIRYYLPCGRYMGWQKFEPSYYLSYANWIPSNNVLKVGNRTYSSIEELRSICFKNNHDLSSFSRLIK